MPYGDTSRKDQYQREYHYQKRLAKARCVGCDRRPVVVRYRASTNVQSIPLCAVCLTALKYAAAESDPVIQTQANPDADRKLIEFPAKIDRAIGNKYGGIIRH